MQNDDLFSIEIPNKLISLDFGLREDDSPVVRVIALDEPQDGLVLLALAHHERIVLHGLGCARRLVLYHVDGCAVSEVALGDVGHPRGDGRREHQVLGLACCLRIYLFENSLYVQFEPFLQHGVRLVDADDLQVAEGHRLPVQEVD